jgi:Immunity protein 8
VVPSLRSTNGGVSAPRVRAGLQGLTTYSPRALEGLAPEDPARFGVSLAAFIGTDSTGPPDAFDFLVCTPRWLAQRFAEHDGRSGVAFDVGFNGRVLFGSGLLLVDCRSAPPFGTPLERCRTATGPDWGVVASRRGRLLVWEYGYRYDDYIDGRPGPPFPPERGRSTSGAG